LRCVAVCCSVLQYTAVHRSDYVVCGSVLQSLQCVAVYSSIAGTLNLSYVINPHCTCMRAHMHTHARAQACVHVCVYVCIQVSRYTFMHS